MVSALSTKIVCPSNSIRGMVVVLTKFRSRKQNYTPAYVRKLEGFLCV